MPLQFGQCKHEADVMYFTGLSGTKMFTMLFEYVKKKAFSMYYWDRSKRFLKVKKENFSVNNNESLVLSSDYDIDSELIHHAKSGPKQKLAL